jgi:dephospho-CoA kinase
MLKIGITGGIGSGKTTICQLFELLGVPVYYADNASRQLLGSDPEIKRSVVALFGEEILDEQKMIDRRKVASRVFGNDVALKKLNAIMHPAVGLDFERWLKQHRSVPYIIKEAAIMFESGAYKQLDKIIALTAPEELRIARVMKRDGSEKEEVERRVAAQMSEQERVERSHYVIVNDEQQLVIPQVLQLHRIFINVI